MHEEFEDRKAPARDEGLHRSGHDLRTVLRMVLWAVLAFVLLLLVLQNGDQIEVDFLGWTVAMPLFALIIGCAGLGAVITAGWLLLRGRRGI